MPGFRAKKESVFHDSGSGERGNRLFLFTLCRPELRGRDPQAASALRPGCRGGGDPFSNPTLCEKTIVDGEVYDNFENGLD